MSGNLDDSQTSNSSNACIPLNVHSEVLQCSSAVPLKHIAFAPVKKISNLNEGQSSSVIKLKLKKVLH